MNARILLWFFLLKISILHGQAVKHSYRFYNNFSVSEPECGIDIPQAKALGNCNLTATPGGFISDSLPSCATKRTVYHTNLHWGLRYPNTSGTVTGTYTIHMYLKTTNWGQTWARIIDFSDGLSDSGIYFKNSGSVTDRCLDFYPTGIIGTCPYFNSSTYYLLTFTRNGQTGVINVYVNDKLFVSYNDVAGQYVGKSGTPIYIFRDDQAVSCESGEANFAYLSFTNQYSSQATVDSVYKDICSIANKTLSINLKISPNPTCSLSQNITIVYAGDRLVPETDYTFDWNWEGGNVVSGTGLGPYVVNWSTSGVKNVTLTVKSTRCGRQISKTRQVIIGNFAISAITKNGSCNGNADGEITINATNGTPPYQYSIDSITYQSTNLFKVMPATYTVFVKDANSCVANDRARVELANDVTLQTLSDTTICQGQLIKLLTVSNAKIFSWIPSQNLDNSELKDPTVAPFTSADYVVTATNGVCSRKDTVHIVVRPPSAKPKVENVSICLGESLPLLTAVGTAIKWFSDSTLQLQVGAGSKFRPNVTASRPVSQTFFLTQTESRSCESDAAIVVFEIKDIPSLRIPERTYTGCFSNAPADTLTIDAGENLSVAYKWYNANGILIGSDRTMSVQQEGIYIIQVINNQQCFKKDTIDVKEFCSSMIFAPDAFTPNQDGMNDIFEIKGKLPNPLLFSVYNRWGELISCANRPEWDGTYRGQPCQEGQYTWKLEIAILSSRQSTQSYEKTGQVLLIR